MSAYKNKYEYKEEDFPNEEKWFDGLICIHQGI